MCIRLSEQEFLEMASVGFKHTGIEDVILWVGPTARSNDLSIIISNEANCFDGKDCFILTIPHYILIGDRNEEVVSEAKLNLIKLWCDKNMRAIKDYSEYKISTGEFLDRLQVL